MRSWTRSLTRFSPTSGSSSSLPTADVVAAGGDGAPTANLVDSVGEPLRADSATHATDLDDDTVGGLHGITKTTNYWFEREISDIEREAEQFAHEWAAKGLPRHDVPRTEPLEPEQVLAKQCAELFRAWQQRVRTKLQDAIEATARKVEEQVGILRTKIARLESIDLELEQREARIEQIRRETKRDDRPVRYETLIRPRWFWIGAVALGLVEFMANFPVFRLLLPMNAALANVATGIADNIDESSLGSGFKMLVAEWATHLEAVVVAFVAVVVLVALGEFAGGSARAWFALDPADHPTAAATIRSHRREQAFKGWVSMAGIVFVLLFLYASRSDIAETTAERVRQDSSAVAAAETRLAQATASGEGEAMATANTELLTLRDVKLKHEEDGRYAITVQRNNLPIALLNLALVATAIVLGFVAAHADLGEKRGEHPDLVKLRDICNRLRGERIDVARDARDASAAGRASAARVRHLLGTQPLREWESKVRRIESVLPRFRGENARARGLDPANVRAFDEPPALDLPPIDESVLPTEPAGFADAVAELHTLSNKQDRLTPATKPEMTQAAPVVAEPELAVIA